jgi:hypothetical protein
MVTGAQTGKKGNTYKIFVAILNEEQPPERLGDRRKY